MRSTFCWLSCAALVVACIDRRGSGDGDPGGVGDLSDQEEDGGKSSLASPTSGEMPALRAVSLSKETLAFGGEIRSYLLAVPKVVVEGKSYPLVLSFHGNPGTAEGMAAGLPFDLASSEEAVIAYPQATDDHWDLYTPTNANADMPFVEALVGEIESKVNIDPKQVFGFGFSGGGFFITQMACRYAGFFKAISVHAGGGPDEAGMGYPKRANGCYDCPGGPTATLVVHGTDDPEVETTSGEFTATCFASENGCRDVRSSSAPAPCEVYDGCPTDKPVKRCIIPGLNHSVWSDGMKASWSFFRALP